MSTLAVDAARFGSSVTRRDFLKAGGLGAVGLALSQAAALPAQEPSDDRAVILLLLVGGPSQLETWDPKPDAPAEVRGPFHSIATTVPGIRINEHLPRLAQRMDRLTLLRALHHDAAPIHETGHQLLQTGRLCRAGQEHPHAGSVVSRLQGTRDDAPPFVLLPGPIRNTGFGVSSGQSAGPLGPSFEPFLPAKALNKGPVFDLRQEPLGIREAYGRNRFGQDCLMARRLIEAGARFVTVNMFESVFDQVTWDCHGTPSFSTLDDYARELLPTFDRAFSALIDDLERTGRLDSTLVVATGEFGRTPRLNASGGRDHWPAVWSAALAGGGSRGGQVIGASDAHAAYPADRPATPSDLLATMYRSLGIDPAGAVPLGDEESMTLVDDAEPIQELFA